MNSLFRLLTIITGIWVLPLISVTAQTNYSVPLSVAVNETAINRVIADQWNQSSFTKSWSGTQAGLSYSIQLGKPWVTLSTNTISVVLPVTVNGTKYHPNPRLTIPPLTIDVTNILTAYDNLRSQIDLVMSLADSRLRDAVYNALSPIQWMVYQGKIMDASTVRFSESYNVAMTGIPSLTVQISVTEILFTATATLASTPPVYDYFQVKTVSPSQIVVRAIANNSFNIKEVRITIAGNGQEIFSSNNPTQVVNGFDSASGKYFSEATINLSEGLSYLKYFIRVVTHRGGNDCLWKFPKDGGVYLPDTTFQGFGGNKLEIVYGEQ